MNEYIERGRGEQRRLSPVEFAKLLGEVRADAASLWAARFSVRQMAAADLKVRYHRSSLGFLWTLLNPLLMLAVLTVVFSQIMRIEMKYFAIYLFSGMLPWQFFTSTILDGGRSLISNETLIKRVRIPKLAFPVTRLLVASVNWLLATGTLLAIIILIGRPAGSALLAFPIVALLWITFSFGIALISVTLITYFRDCEHFLEVFFQAWYFASPILYPIALLGDKAKWIMLNPVTHYMNLFHLVIYESKWPSLGDWSIPGALSIVSLCIGYVVFKRHEDDFVFRL